MSLAEIPGIITKIKKDKIVIMTSNEEVEVPKKLVIKKHFGRIKIGARINYIKDTFEDYIEIEKDENEIIPE